MRTSSWTGFWIPLPPRLEEREEERLLSMVTEAERLRYRGITSSARCAFLCGRGLIRTVLGSALAREPSRVPLEISVHGKPTLAPSVVDPLFFNLSHSRDQLIAAFSPHAQVGVDIEVVGGYQDAVAERFLRNDEYAALQRVEPEARPGAFCHLWTAKEACVKALGRPLGPNVRRVAVSLDASGRHGDVRWESLELRDDVRAAVALHPLRHPISDRRRLFALSVDQIAMIG